MKRFLKVLTLLIISLFIVVSGVNAAIDRLSRAPVHSSIVVYDEKGAVLLAYNGDLTRFKASVKPERVIAPVFLHRT